MFVFPFPYVLLDDRSYLKSTVILHYYYSCYYTHSHIHIHTHTHTHTHTNPGLGRNGQL